MMAARPMTVSSSPPERANGGSRRLLGTFGGVFTPSILTILGIILFRRLGYVVGSAGVLQALLMLALATAISVNTSMSLSAIATSRRVRGGGDYYLISRSLGVEYGGALGVLLFLAQAVSVAFYCVGFGEGVAAIVGGADLFVRVAAVGAAVGLFGLAYAGSDLATRFQYVIMAILAAALASFFVGAYAGWDPVLLQAGVTPGPDAGEVSFGPLFAIFFPAVTGFTQGVSMSGDLKDASRSLPRGTFLAVGLATVVYGAAIVMFQRPDRSTTWSSITRRWGAWPVWGGSSGPGCCRRPCRRRWRRFSAPRVSCRRWPATGCSQDWVRSPWSSPVPAIRAARWC